ncbi:MAG TPA: EAL domain-containing response regulator [Thermoanaerobaculia bacterium]
MRNETVLILDDSQDVTEALAAGLQRNGRRILTCNDVESAQIVLERVSVSYVVLDIQFSGQFGFEGLDLISHARRHSPSSRIVVMTGNATPDLRAEALRRGAIGFFEKPFGIDELESLFIPRFPAEALNVEGSSFMRVPMIDEILAGGLTPVFQPIIDLAGDGSIFSFEALARCHGGTIFSNPEILFDYGARKKRLLDLELACIEQAFRDGVSLSERRRLFINVHPHVLSTGKEFVSGLIDLAKRKSFPLDRLVIEITEQCSIVDPVAAIDAVDALRLHGIRFALDDVGVAYSHLGLIDRIAPSFLKISQHFGTDFEKDPTKTKIVRNIASLAQDFSCAVILEGIEGAATAAAAREIGIQFGQGYYFARPAQAETFGDIAAIA